MPLNYLEWLGIMNDEALWALDNGWAPIVPGNDLLMCYRSPRKLTMDEILSMDHALISVSTALRVIDTRHRDGSQSIGVVSEIAFAKSIGVPVCYTRWATQKAYAENERRTGMTS